jgi:hypothetical protein
LCGESIGVSALALTPIPCNKVAENFQKKHAATTSGQCAVPVGKGAPALRGETRFVPLNCARPLMGEGSENAHTAARRGHVDSCKRDLAAAAFNGGSGSLVGVGSVPAWAYEQASQGRNQHGRH